MSSEVWLPIATLVLGIVLSQGATWLNRKWELEQERDERRMAFHRETILEAQDTVGTVMKVLGETSVIEQGFRNPKYEGVLGESDIQLYLDLTLEHNRAVTRLYSLTTRVDDPILATHLEDFYVLMNREPETVGKKREKAVTLINKRIRALLPDLY